MQRMPDNGAVRGAPEIGAWEALEYLALGQSVMLEPIA
jgi:hypothetical protein